MLLWNSFLFCTLELVKNLIKVYSQIVKQFEMLSEKVFFFKFISKQKFETWGVVLQHEVLVGEGVRAVDGVASGAILVLEVSTLEHEFRNHSVEVWSLITETVFACKKKKTNFKILLERFQELPGNIRKLVDCQ